jgi:signal transduction histidine kinase/ActR/RegA family two-component response regulator
LPIHWNPYALAVLVTLAGVAITRVTWPFFSAAPFAPVFAAVAISTHWGGGAAGLLAIVLGPIGIALSFPQSGGFPWHPMSLTVYAAVAVVGSRLINGRNKATAALRASEAELRATLEDIRASEEKLRRAQKMEAIGQLAAGVAHNFNNLLQVTMGYTDMLLDERDNAQVTSAAMEIRRATERGAVLTRQLLTFGRKHDPRVTRVDLDATISALGDMLSRIIREDMVLTMDLGCGRLVLIDPYDLEQVVFNLVMNARDALPRGGTIHVSVDVATGDDAIGTGDHPVAPGQYVRLRVQDDGIGMTPEVQAHLFEPFFTTKDVGEGTGLGLPFVQGVARHAGGFVTVETAPQQGTTVAVYLPPIDGPASAPPEPVSASAAVPRSPVAGTILVVEDEAAVRGATTRMLERAGYTVLAAATPSDACTIFEAERARINLLLTDIVMPDMHGPALAERLLAVRSDLPVVFVSGYSDTMPPAEAGGTRATFLAKPFTAAELIGAVQDALARANSAQ